MQSKGRHAVSTSGPEHPPPEVRRRRRGPDWVWSFLGIFGIGQPIVDRERMYGEDRRNDPYQHDFDPNRKPDE